MMIAATASTASQPWAALEAGMIDPGLAAPIILGVVLGATLGTRLLVRLTNQMVRRFFLLVLLILGIEMILRGIWGT